MSEDADLEFALLALAAKKVAAEPAVAPTDRGGVASVGERSIHLLALGTHDEVY
jgi:hypothetical protein